MVLLTMTATIVKALETLKIHPIPAESAEDVPKATEAPDAPPLSRPAIGNPISHSQIIDIHRQLKAKGDSSYHLDTLLLGSRVYVPPPAPKPEPTPEYKALMARLRREEETRAYSRMLNLARGDGSGPEEGPPRASAAHAFSATAAYDTSTTEEDGITYADASRQMALIFNVLVSIVACAAAIWMAAKWWDTPARLALSMSGSLLVAVAEVVVYTGYIRRLEEAKGKEKAMREVKKIVKTWVVDGKEDGPIKDGSDSKTQAGKEDISTVRERKRWKER